MKKLLLTKSAIPQNLVKIGDTIWKLEPFFEIQDGGRSRCGLMKKLMFTKLVLPQNLVKIGETVWKLEPVFEIQGSFGESVPQSKLEKTP